MHVISGSDDATVRWWDLATGTQIRRLDGHQDYVRAVAGSPAGSEVRHLRVWSPLVLRGLVTTASYVLL